MSSQFTILTCRKFSCQISHTEAWETHTEFLRQKLEQSVLSGELREKNVYHFIWLGPLIIPVAEAAVATCICVMRLSVGWQVHFSNGIRRWEASPHVSSCLLFCRMYFANRSSMQNFISWVWSKFLLFVSCNRYSGLYLEQGLYLTNCGTMWPHLS